MGALRVAGRLGLSVARMLAVVFVIASGALYWFQERLVFVPTRGAPANDPASVGLAFEDVELHTDDGERLHAWYVPATAPDGVTVLFAHGNAGHMGHRLHTLRLHAGLGHGVLMFDYRGYGRSTGRPTEQGTYLDARAAWRHLTDGRGINPARIVLHGRSLGAAVCIALASEVPAAALVAESGFTSVPDLAAELYPFLPVRWLARVHYPSGERIGALAMPVLIAHSVDDELIGFAHAERLAALAPPGTELLRMRGGHGDGYVATGAAYTDALRDFVARNVTGGRRHAAAPTPPASG